MPNPARRTEFNFEQNVAFEFQRPRFVIVYQMVRGSYVSLQSVLAHHDEIPAASGRSQPEPQA